MLRPFLIAVAFCFALAPATARPPSAWADTVVMADAGVADDAPPVSVNDAGVVVPAPNSPAANVETDPMGTARAIVEDAKSGNWRLALGGILAVLFAVGLRVAPKLFGTTDRGKAITVMVLALLGAFASALVTSTPISIELLGGAVGVAFTAVGGRQWLSRVLWPQDGGKQVATGLQPWLGVKPKP